MIRNDYEDYSDTVLYDVFYEAGTRLGGTLVHLQGLAEDSGNQSLAEEYEQRRFALKAERDSVDAFDRATQISKIKKWNSLRNELADKELPIAV